ncbi:MAG: DUF4382 domain-containing protein [Chitinophagaceae bacterium]
MKKNWLTLLAIISFFTLASCNKTSYSSGQPSHLNLYLTDDPGNYDAVYVDIESIEVNTSGDSTTSPWQTIPLLKQGVYNLLDFRNGIDTVLSSIDFPSGTISQMRMVLGNNNSVVVNGVSYPLTTPSAQQSGLKFNIDANLVAGITYRLYIDFDAERSIVSAGNTGKYILKPVIRTYAQATGGAIKGVVLPVSAHPGIFAFMGTDTISTLPDSNGNYLMSGVPAGIWGLEFIPGDTSYKSQNVNNIDVTSNVVTQVDSVNLIK